MREAGVMIRKQGGCCMRKLIFHIDVNSAYLSWQEEAPV